MSPDLVAGIVALVVLLAVAGIASAAETVLQRMDYVRALTLDEDEPGAGDLVWILQHRGSALNATLLVTVVVRVATASIATVFVARQLAGAPGVAASIAGVAVASLIGAEMAPRIIAMHRLDQTGLRLAPVVRRTTKVVNPFASLLLTVSRNLPGVRPEGSGPYPSDEPSGDLEDEDLVVDDELEEEERAMIRSIVELGDTIAREIMVPRPDMVVVDRTATLQDLVNTIVEHGYSRLPVHEDDREHIIGVVYAKDVLRRLALQPDRSGWYDLVRDATFIPETKQIDDLLRELQEQSVHIAFVVDEYGATTGLVTIEDILEEIVGEIVDEHDHEEPLVELVEDGVWVIDARLPVDDLNDLLSVSLPDDDWDTVGGLVVGALGHVPAVGEQVELGGVRFVTSRVQGRRVAQVRVEASTTPVEA